jgi:hypothetical protein
MREVPWLSSKKFYVGNEFIVKRSFTQVKLCRKSSTFYCKIVHRGCWKLSSTPWSCGPVTSVQDVELFPQLFFTVNGKIRPTAFFTVVLFGSNTLSLSQLSVCLATFISLTLSSLCVVGRACVSQLTEKGRKEASFLLLFRSQYSRKCRSSSS